MRSQRRESRFAATVGGLVVATLLAVGCATTGSVSDRGAADRTALILATDGYELHYQEGRVVVVPVDGAQQPSPRDVESYEEFKALYEVRKDEELPLEQPREGVEVNGWRGLECVRRGHACGAGSDYPPPVELIRLRVLFPN